MFKSALQALRTTPLRLMILAQALAIAAQLSVLLTADRYQQLFSLEAAALLGGDMVVQADREPSATLAAAARDAGLQLAKTTLFNSVALAGAEQTLVSVKAVDQSYPLRGVIKFKQTLGKEQGSAPKAGQVWVDEGLLQRLGLSADIQAQHRISLGATTFLVTAVIDVEPDRGVQFISFAPRVMLSQADLPATQLLGEGSRASYRWQLVGAAPALAQFKQWYKANPTAGQRLETLDEGRPEMRTTLDRASRFLGLIAILTTLIAACGLGLVAHIWAKEQSQTVALMRTLGASAGNVARRLLAQLAWASALGLCIGVLTAYGLHLLLANWLVTAEGVTLPAASATPYLQAVLLLIVLLLACVSGPIQALLKTQPIQILRGQLPSVAITGGTWLQANGALWVFRSLAIVVVSALLIWVAGNVTQGLIVLAALAAVVLMIVASVYGLMRLSLRLGRTHARWTLRTAARGLLRNPTLTLVQASAMTLALLGVLMLALLQRDVLNAWQTLLPKDAPNHFVFNIQPDQVSGVRQQLTALDVPNPSVLPMIRARLVQINGAPVDLEKYPEERAKNLINREFNLSYNRDLPAGNELIGGRWHGDTPGEISMEAGILKTLNLKLGDTLTFDIAGQSSVMVLSSVRKLRWESLNVNFFAIASPASVQNMPQTYIASIFVPPQSKIAQLVRPFPNLTVMDVGAMAAQGRTVLNKVSRALTLLFGLGVVAGAVVIAIIAYASRLARLRETALLRIMGASAAQVRAAQLLEQTGIGALAGLVAGAASYAAVASLSTLVLELPVTIGLWPIWIGALLGATVNVVAYFALQWQWRPVPLGTQVRALGI